MNYPPHTEQKVQEIVEVATKYGDSSIIALAGVPGTGKSYLASIAAQRIAHDPLYVFETQFHPSYTYDDFIEGLRITDNGGVEPKPGVFSRINDLALDNEDTSHRFVLLIEELTRANLSSVLGELLTYIEYRDRYFERLYSNTRTRVAKNLVILATFNPSDRSAIEIDSALLRRLRIIQCPPDENQLLEMLQSRNLDPECIAGLQNLFVSCRNRHGDTFDQLMPFGHGVFSQVQAEIPDLNQLWEERLRHFLRRSIADDHPYRQDIEQAYPWRDPSYKSKQQTPP